MQIAYNAEKSRIKEKLIPFGTYLAYRGAEKGEARLSFADLGWLASALILWGISGYLKAYIEEIGKIHAKRDFGTMPLDEKELDVEAEKLINHYKESKIVISDPAKLDKNELVSELTKIGFTERGAKKAVDELTVDLEKSIITILNEKEQ